MAAPTETFEDIYWCGFCGKRIARESMRSHRDSCTEPSLATTKKYKLVSHTGTFPQYGKEWNPVMVTSTSWWVEGPGIERPATIEEQDIARTIIDRVLEIVAPFDELVNVTAAGGTPTAAIRKEYGIA